KLQPEKVIDLLKVTPADTVADLGAGPGMFTIPLAKLSKKVFAVDVEPEMLERLKKNAENENIENITYVNNDLEKIDMNDESVTCVLNTFVIHEVSSVTNTVEEMKRILKPDGRLLLADWEATGSESGPPLEIRIPSTEMEKILQNHGFQTELLQLNSEHYAILAHKKE